MSFIGELQRRNVVRVGVAYVVTSWLVLQIADTLLEAMGAPDWTMRALLSLALLGFLPALVFAWAFEITPEGIKPESQVDRNQSIAHQTARKLDIVVILMLLVAVGFLAWDSAREEGQAIDARQAQRPVVDAAPGPAALPGEGSGVAPVTGKSIAVLPFVNLSSDPEQEFFSDGISEELLNVLAKVPELQVAARTSSFQFKGDNRDISEIAQLLKVNHVLEGSVRKAGSRLRITAQLIEAENGYHLWSDTYDRELDDVFAIQDEISAAISDALLAQLGIGQQRAAPRVAETANTAAYEAYLKGRYLVNQRGNRAISEAVRELEKSIRLDPNFAPAHAQLAIAIALSNNSPSSYGDLTVAQVNTRATPHARLAMELDPQLAESWGAKSLLAAINGEDEMAIEYAKKALDFNPVYTDALNWIQTSALLIGRYQEGKDAILRVMEVDPLSVVGRVNYYSNHIVRSNRAEALRGAETLAQQHKWAGYASLANIADRHGDIAESLYWLLRAYAYDPLDRFSNQAMVDDFCRLRLSGEARRVSDVTAVDAEATCGDLDKALEGVERLIAMDPDDPYLVQGKASLLYWTGDKAAALAIYQEIAEGRGTLPMISDGYSLRDHLYFTWLLQQSGKLSAANVELAKIDRDFAARQGTAMAEYVSHTWDLGLRALLAGDREAAVARFRDAVLAGHRDWQDFEDPMLESLSGDEGFESVQALLDEKLAIERDKALVTMCVENPVPESWQPLAETCAELVEPAPAG